MNRIYSTLLLSLFAIGTYSQIDRATMPKPGPPPEINLGQPNTFKLNNGLKVMVVEDHKLPRVSIQLTIDNPPVLEGEKAGVSALTASLLGNGSQSIPKDDFNEEVDFLGASINFGSQSAYAAALSKYFPRILELLADAAINPNFTQEDFDTEKARLITSVQSEERDVAAIADRLEAALAYGKDHPYGEFITEESLNRVTLADVDKFYHDYFVPANAYLVIIGDIQFEEVRDLVTQYFAPWVIAVPPSFSFTKPAGVQYTQVSFVDMPNAVQSEISVQHLIDLKMKDPDYLPALLANQIFGGGAQGRIQKNIREDKGYAYYAYSIMGSDKYAPATFKALTSVRNAVTDSAVVQLLHEMDSITMPTITADELKEIKAKYTGAFVMALEKPQTIAKYALNIETEGLPADFYATYLERLNAITVEQVQQAANKYISPSNSRLVIAGKGSEVMEKLEAIKFKGKPLVVKYFDKEANPVAKPEYNTKVPEGVSVGTVINRYFDAIGGQQAVNAITTLRTVYVGNLSGSAIKIEEVRTAENYAQTTYMNEAPMMGVIAKGDELFMKQGGNKMPLPPAMQKDMKSAMGIFPEQSILINPEARLTGVEKVEGSNAYVILVPGEVVQASYFYDVETGLKIKEAVTISMNGQTQNEEVIYKEYKAFEGIKLPSVRIGNLGPQVLESTLEDVELNGAVSEEEFK